MALWCPFGWSWRSHLVVLVEEPVLFWVVQRIDHLWHKFVLLRYLEHGTGIFMPSAVVSCREDSEELATGESFEAIHDAFVSTQNESTPVGVKEVLDTVRAELDDIACAIGVSNEVRLDAKVLVTISGVRPKDVNHKLLLWGRNLVDHLKRTLDLLDLVQTQECAANATMQADNTIVDNGSKRQPVK